MKEDHSSSVAQSDGRDAKSSGEGSADIRHGEWSIYPTEFCAHHRWREIAWTYCHDGFDGAEDANDHRCGTAASVEACIAEIDNWEADHEA